MSTTHPPEISALFDLSLDIERHESDRRFADGGEIIYVFDENIFELFVFPKAFRRYCRIFFAGAPSGQEQSSTPTGTEPRHLRSLTIQSALATAEYLFSGALPGQDPSKKEIYLTPWHREELLDRLSELVTEAADVALIQAGSPTVQKKLDYFRQNQGAPPGSNWRQQTYRDKFVANDLDDLKGLSEDSLATFARTREMALVLGEDEVYEPLQQLQRIVSPEIQGRLKGIVNRQRPGARDEAKILARAEEWWDALQDEIELREHLKIVRHPRRKDSTAWRDCQSLAMVEWYSTTLNEDTQRVVLVTGDETLFDAYRRSYVRAPKPNAFRNTGFLLRRPKQYSPVFNSNLVGPGYGDPQSLFYHARGIVQTALTALQLSSMPSLSARPSEIRNGEALTLRPLGDRSRKALPPIEVSWRSQIQASNAEADPWFEALKSRWCRGERVRIGWANEAINNRMSDVERDLFKTVTSTPSEHEGRLIEEYLASTARDLANRTLDIWRPIAAKSFNQWVGAQPNKTERVPVSVFLPVTYDGAIADLLGLLNASAANHASREQPSDAVEFLATQFELFVASAVLALMRHEWRFAQHFSDMATKTFEHAQPKDRPTEVRAAEAYYCLALALRFRLGELGFSSYGHARRLFERAQKALVNCKNYGADLQATRKERHFNLVREFRVHGETAALFGFKALHELLRDEPSLSDAIALTTHAKQHLDECDQLRREALDRIITMDSGIDAYRVLAHQFLVNRAATHLLRLAVGEDITALKAESTCQATLDELDAATGRISEAHSPILQFELHAFACIFGNAKAVDHGAFVRRIAESNPLEIDARWSMRLATLISQHTPAPEV